MLKFDVLAGFSGRKAVLKSILLVAVAVAVGTGVPTIASAASAPEASAVRAVSMTTDLSAARRRHQPRSYGAERQAPTLRSFGNTMNYGPYEGAAGSSSFGYGVGDNSRNQTW